MRFFAAYRDSPLGYDFKARRRPPSQGGAWAQGSCILSKERLPAHLEAPEQSGSAYLYLPLAVLAYSGCTFFWPGSSSVTIGLPKDCTSLPGILQGGLLSPPKNVVGTAGPHGGGKSPPCMPARQQTGSDTLSPCRVSGAGFDVR